MAVYSVTKHGYLSIQSLMTDIHAELTNAHSGKTYFVKKFGTPGSGIVIYESATDIDPLANYTPANNTINCAWRLVFNHVDSNRLAVHAGTVLQFPDSGTISFLNSRSITSPQNVEPPGNLSKIWSTSGTPAATSTTEVWLNRQMDVGNEGSYPMSYTLTLTNRGIFLSVWEDSQEEVPTQIDAASGHGNSPFRWFLIQRSVDRLTGHVRGGGAMRGSNDPTTETSRCPVFAVGGTSIPTSIATGVLLYDQFYKFIVRENDVLSPSRKKPAVVDSTDSGALMNPFQQQSLTETGEFVITFFNNLSTPRYRYGDELDMVGTVSAEVIGPGTSIDVTVYNEPQTRRYTALYATEAYGVGVRLMVLTQGNSAVEDSHVYVGGIAPTTTTTSTTSTTTVAPSDMRLKSDIIRIGTHELGIGIYEYNIFNRREIGLMAQEVLGVRPMAVEMYNDGYYRVNYDMMNFERKVLEVN